MPPPVTALFPGATLGPSVTVTVTVACLVAVPPLLEAVRLYVYVVVVVGDTVTVLETELRTLPTPLSMFKAFGVPPDKLQDRVTVEV